MKSFVAILLGMICLFMACSGASPVAGTKGGSETTNGVTAVVYRNNGAPAASVNVRLRRADYLAQSPSLLKSSIFSADTLTDSLGRFEIIGVTPGEYSIEVSDSHSAVLFSCAIDAGAMENLGTDTVRPFAVIVGTVDSASGPVYIQVYGMERVVLAGPDGNFSISDLPSGAFSLHAASSGTTPALTDVANIKVGVGDTAHCAINSQWAGTRRLYLNTTASGAGITGDVVDFPLLVRLDSSLIDFSESRDSGQDLRFSKADGSAIPCEVARWDRALQRAEVWVKIDTVLGNNANQYIEMSWGNQSAPSGSNGASVFTAAAGFAAVWHLDENATGAAGEFLDASGNGNNGTGGPGATRITERVPGIACKAQRFDSSSIEVADNPSLEPPNSMTISAWVKLDAVPLAGDQDFFIADKVQSDWQAYFFRVQSSSQTVQFVWSNTFRTVGDAIGATRLTAGSWYHIAAVKQDSVISIFINGRDDTFYRTNVTGTMYDSTSTLMLGSFYQRGNRGGSIDEVQVSKVARSADWIKLSFENQRPGGRLFQ